MHFVLRKSFLLVSFDRDRAYKKGLRVRWWDFLFYALFGLVVTSFVRIAGVLLVFSYLIVPAVCGINLSGTIGKRLIIGWLIALIGGIAGLLFSFSVGSAIGRRDRVHVWRAAHPGLGCWIVPTAAGSTRVAEGRTVHSFHYRNGRLHCEGADLDQVAEKFGTPLYVYSVGTIRDHYRRLDAALPDVDHLICYAIKANSNRAILDLLAREGARFDFVSGGELFRVLAARGHPDEVHLRWCREIPRGD